MSAKIENFTSEVPVWKPYVTPIDLDQASDAQREALKVTPSNTKVSDYVLVLAHDPETLSPRTPLFNGIMYNRGGLSRAERELGAIGASIVNRCIYCAAVHANRYNQLTKDDAVTARIFKEGVDAELEPRAKAILEFSTNLSQCPPQATSADLARLRDAGLDDAEILDLVLSAALFGWANRLMHTLGEPVKDEAA
ncbi:MAG: peroxidase-related enzyme [Pseudomonadota bacterium]